MQDIYEKLDGYLLIRFKTYHSKNVDIIDYVYTSLLIRFNNIRCYEIVIISLKNGMIGIGQCHNYISINIIDVIKFDYKDVV